MRNDAGMTFFELMVVLGILAILAGIAVPSYINWLPNYRLRSAADEIQSTLQNARLRAVRENAVVRLEFDFLDESYLAYLDNGAGGNAENGVQDADELTVQNGQMPTGIDLQNPPADQDPLGPAVQFDRRGFPNLGGNIDVANSTRIQRINLTLGGSSSFQ